MISLIVIVCVAVFFGLNYSIERKLNELKGHTITQYMEITESRANEVSKELAGIINQVRMISKSTVVQTMDLTIIKDYLKSLVEDSNIRSMTLSDVSGKAWTTYDLDIDISNQEQFKSIIIDQKEWIISNPFHSPYFFEDIPIITISHQIKVNNEIVGLLNAVVTTEFMNKITDSIQFKNLSFAWIIDSNGNIVSHPNELITIDQTYNNILQFEGSDPFVNSNGSFDYLDENNKSMLAVYSTIPNTSGWKLIISIENRNAFTELTSVMNYIDYALLISLVILILFSLIYANSISEPILRLRHVFERAEKGDLNVKADESVKNEIGLAGVSFNHMLQEIKNLTYIDPVTQISNYRSYLSESNVLIQSSKNDTFYVVVISIDDFKKINSLGGYGFGNETLKKFAELIKSQLNEDEIIARYFGDEMILLLKENDLEVLRNRISLLLKECQRPFIIMDIDIHLSISCGIAKHIPTDTIETSIHNSTIAKLKAKKLGGNIAIFYGDGINQEIKLVQDIEKELYHAIDRNELYL
ncbi:MAG: GGDEF domain-containing protein, partial [Erysipelotrichaceae bacterium]